MNNETSALRKKIADQAEIIASYQARESELLERLQDYERFGDCLGLRMKLSVMEHIPMGTVAGAKMTGLHHQIIMVDTLGVEG